MPSSRSALSQADLRYFIEVSRVRNISRAAERLGISQPSLSAAVKRLERRFQSDLLIRRTSGVELTREGKLFAARAKALLDEWDALEATVTQQREEPSGSFTFGAHVSVALNWFPRLLPPLLKRWPRLDLQITHDLSRKVNEQVVSHQLDFGLVVNPLKHPDLVVTKLATDVFTFWGRGKNFSDTVLFDPDLLQAQELIARIEKRGIYFQRKLTSSSLDLLARLAAQGVGTAILPTHLAERTRPILRRPSGDLPEVQDTICLVYRADAQRSPSARALLSALRATRLGAPALHPTQEKR